MKLKSVLMILTLIFGVTACSSLNKLVYRIDVPQGNYLESDKVAQLKKGMTAEQVQYLLGTPLLVDPFNSLTWYYVQLIQNGHEKPIEHKLTINFNQNGLVTDFQLDNPLSEKTIDRTPIITPTSVIAPTETSTSQDTSKTKKSWWQFWK
ncbi:outer membrane protein assembly factor BamE [Mergibacter septicus]|uniref:Outer membrane protein assembly factor BamE n=1 Tax=Mergibacter septicus TaxID=221402 RepID=A0A8E3MFE8_9PAST|nr:outer membrane protein assembly factor BamE [Mergibacter septicus]AWX14951.1 outer membrane protein assembly factor BamE [Mergibacter septicus]QDJ14203.1 outer membrane protein assembly factor BamE [Mergibacter septicus]UTU48350.1 outer membrane protein assembly factor BamE [Mergibacter septicus]WMR96023.1 outer membrane protein assembly factor BamE [Mergibacter septicus]